jgi:hypothetical protein
MNTVNTVDDFKHAAKKAGERIWWLEPVIECLEFVPDPEVETASISSSGVMRFSPTWSLSPSQRVTLVLHEALHPFREHSQRFVKWYLSLPSHLQALPLPLLDKAFRLGADAEINDDLEQIGLELPPDPILPRLFGMHANDLAEHYATAIISNISRDKIGGLHSCGGNGVTATPPSSSQSGASEGDSPGGGQHGGEEQGGGGVPLGNDGGVQGEGDTPSVGDGEDIEERIRTVRLREAIKEAARRILSNDTGPGRTNQDVEAAKRILAADYVDWLSIIRGYVWSSPSHGREVHTYRRPSRRHPGGDLILPGKTAGQARFGVLLDVSDSMLPILSQVLLQFSRCLWQTGRPVDVYLGNTQIRHTMLGVTSISPVEDAVKKNAGGATHMGYCLREIERKHVKYDLVLVLTDGATSWLPYVRRDVKLSPPIPAPWPVVPVIFDREYSRESFWEKVQREGAEQEDFALPDDWYHRVVWVHVTV